MEHFESGSGRASGQRCEAIPLWLMILHLIVVPLVPLYWRWAMKVPSCPCGLHVTVEFWFGFASLCLVLYACAAMRTVWGLWRDVDERSLDLKSPGLARRLVLSKSLLYSPLTIAICASLLALFQCEKATEMVGQGDLTYSGLGLLSVASCILALSLPGLAAWLSLVSARKALTRSATAWLLAGWSFGAFYLWMLCVPPLRLLGLFPLPQLCAAVLIAVGLASLAPWLGDGRWGFASTALTVGLSLQLVPSYTIAHHESLDLILFALGICIALLGLLPPRGKGKYSRSPRGLCFVAQGALAGCLTFLSWIWIRSAFYNPRWDPSWLSSVPFSPITYFGAFTGATWALLRMLFERR